MLDENLKMLIETAKLAGIEKLVLFGSRAKGTYSKNSDYDVLAYGGRYTDFALEAEYNMLSLGSFDIHNAADVSDDFLKEIEKTGVTIYEKTE